MNIRTGRKGIGKRFIALLTTMSMTVGIVPAFYLNAFAAGEFSGGSGTSSDPYIIGSAADLKALADKVNAGDESFAAAYYKMPTETYTYTDQKGEEHTDGVRNISINLSGYDTWTPIGTEEHPFKGHFNGSSNENKGNGSYGRIYNFNLKIDEQEITAPNRRVQAVGLFGYVDGATIENLYTADAAVGDLKLNTYNTYEGGEQSYHCIGGVVGFAKNSTIRFCTNHAPLTVTAAMGRDGGKNPELYVGGVVGGETGSEIFRCINNGTVGVKLKEDSFAGKKLPDIYAGGVVGGVNGISSAASTIHGSENLNRVTVNAPVSANADNLKIYAGGVAGGASGIEADKLELCQDYNRSSSAAINVSTGTNASVNGDNVVVCAGGILGYDDPDKKIHVHDSKNDASVANTVDVTGANKNLYAGGIVAGRGNVDNCLNGGTVNPTQGVYVSGICYSVPHHCYSTGISPEAPICVEIPDNQNIKYYNYCTHSTSASKCAELKSENWQCYISDTLFINSGGLTWLLQGDQDPNYLHWTATGGAPLLAGGYYVKTGGRPLDYWLNIGWGAYNNDMGREIISFAPAWSYRIAKYRYVTTGEGNDGVDPTTKEDLKADTTFASFEKSTTDQFYAVGYGYYCGRIGALPSVAETDEKKFVQWQTTPAASEDESVNLGSSFAYSGSNSTVYAVARVKFGAKDNDGVYRSVYGNGNEIKALNTNMEYAAEPDTTEGKFTYGLSGVTTEDGAMEDADLYFAIDGEKLTVAKNTPVGVYTVGVTAEEKSPVYTLFSASNGFDEAQFTLTVEVIKADPDYTAPQSKQREYDGTKDDVITAGSTGDGKILYTLTPTDDTSWSETVPQDSELGLYTVYWKIEGDSNHNDKSPSVVSGLIYPDSSDPANAIIVTPAADWTYDGNTYPLATVTKPSFAEIEWSSDNTTWTDTLPTATNAGSYPVYWRVKKNDYNIDDHGSFTVKVSKATLTVTPPVGLTKKYNGEAQELVTAGSAAPAGKGTMKYSLNPEVSNWADSNWSETIPTRTNAGEYKVYYRVFPDDLNNYTDTFDKANPTFVNSEISKLTKEDLGDTLKVVPTPDWTYDGSTRKLVNETETKVPADKGLRLIYSTDGKKWDYIVPTGTDADDYTVYWKTTGNNNIDEVSGEFTVKVSKKKPNIVIEKHPDWQYDGKTYQLIEIKENNDNLRFSYSVNGGEAQTTVPYAKDAGTYKVSVTSKPNKNYETYQGSFEIKCTPAKTTGSIAANTLTFNYGAQELVTSNDDVTNGKLMYKVEGENAYYDTIPKRTDAGTYTVWYYVKGNDANYADTEPASVDVTIAKLEPVPAENISAGLEYNETAQTLLTVDTDHGKIKYAVKTDGTAPSERDWTAEIPKATDAGDYTVYWKVDDDSGRNDGETNLVPKSGSEIVTIAKYKATIAYVHAEDLPYNGKEQQLIEEIKERNGMGTVKYALKTDSSEPAEGDWKTDIPTGMNAYEYTVYFKIDGDGKNIENSGKQKVKVKITKVVPKISVTVKGALKYNAGSKQDLVVRSATVIDALPGGGTLLFAVTDTESATPADGDWSTDYPQREEKGIYYVWYRFDGDGNTESIAAKKATSVINGDIPSVTVSGKHLDYTGRAQKLIEGAIDDVNIENNTKVKYYISENESETFTAEAQTSTWSTDFPTKTDAKKYYVWYYVPAEGGNLAVGPAMVEAEIRKAPAVEYDFTKENSSKLTADGQSFTVQYGTMIKDIALQNSEYGTYEWHEDVKTRTLTTIGGPYNYPARFAATNNNYESGIVQIKVTVTKIPEPTPNIGIDYIAEKLTGFDPTKIYTIWGGEHTDSTTLDIPEEYMTGDDVKYPIVLKASTDYTKDSEALELPIPTRPPAPKLKAEGGDLEVHQPAFLTASGRISGIASNMEYSIGDSRTWITGSGSELTVPQNTKVYVRYKAVAEDETVPNSGSFKSLPVTLEVKESERTKLSFGDEPGINYPNHTIKDLEPNTKYTISYTDEDGQEHKYRVETDEHGEVPIEEEWHNETVSIVKNGDILYTVDSDPEELYIPPRPDPPNPQSEDSKITNVLKTDEYRLRTDKTYTDVENDGSTVVVDPDKYVVRVKAVEETATQRGSFASLDAPVTVREITPNAEIDYVAETLNNLLPNTEYVITEPDGNVISVVTDSNGEIPIKDSWFGERVGGNEVDKILLIQKKGKTDDENSLPQTRPIPPRPDKPEPDSRDSKIIEVNKTMEYRLASVSDNKNSYTTVEYNNATKAVAPNEYEVRIKAVEQTSTTVGSFASLPATVKVEPMPMPDGKIDYDEVKIENLEPGADYTIIDENGNEEQVTADENGKIPIKEEWMETEIEIIRNGDDATEDSEAQRLPIPDFSNPATPQPTTNPTQRGGSGGGGGKATVTPAPTPSPTPSTASGGDIPALNKTDHFAYISGYEDNTFRPDRTITRGEAAAIFARLMMDTEDAYKDYTPSFPDLAEDMYFYSQVGYLEQYGIITGYEDGTFRPWESITRTEFAVIASKFAELSETEENAFTDVAEDFWGKPFILLAHKNGWVNGYEDNTFRPYRTITRAEVVSIVNRMLERSCDTDFAKNNADKIKLFGDVSQSHWAYNDVLEAANGHLYTTEDGSEVWTDLI